MRAVGDEEPFALGWATCEAGTRESGFVLGKFHCPGKTLSGGAKSRVSNLTWKPT